MNQRSSLKNLAIFCATHNFDFWVNLVRSYRGMSDFMTARQMFDRAIAIAPDEIDIVGMKAETYIAEGDLDAAEELLRGRKIDSFGDALYQQLELLVCRRRFAEAVTLLSRLAETAAVKATPILAAEPKAYIGEINLT